MIRIYAKLLRGADELLRKIHLVALAVGAGVGVVFLYDPSLPRAFGIARVLGLRIEDVFQPDEAGAPGEGEGRLRESSPAG